MMNVQFTYDEVTKLEAEGLLDPLLDAIAAAADKLGVADKPIVDMGLTVATVAVARVRAETHRQARLMDSEVPHRQIDT